MNSSENKRYGRISGKMVFLVGLALTAGCINSELTRRYKSASFEQKSSCVQKAGDSRSSLIRLSAFTIDPPHASDDKPLILQLSDKGQAALIGQLGSNTQAIASFIEALAERKKSGASSDVIDTTVFTKRIVFSSECPLADGVNIGPADRIAELRMTLLDLSNAQFRSWNRFDTAYGTVELGKIGLSQSRDWKLSAEVSPKLGGITPASVGAEMSSGRNLTEEMSLRCRYVQLSGRLGEKEASLQQQGTVGVDLTGNFTADLAITVDAAPFYENVVVASDLFKGKEASDASDVTIRIKSLKYPAKHSNITATIKGEYLLRHVLKNGRTVVEGDDKVKYIAGNCATDGSVVLVRADEMVSARYGIGSYNLSATESSPNGFMLHMEGPETTPVYFADYNEAKEFLCWLRLKKCSSVASYNLTINDRSLKENDLANLTVIRRDLYAK